MIKTFLTRPQTHLLLSVLDHQRLDHYQAEKQVAKLLRMGANPWGTNKHGRSVFSLMMTITPHPEAIEAWFKAAGDLTKAPWTKHKCASPLRDAVENCSQTDLFKEKLIVRMLNQGVSMEGADLPGCSIMDRTLGNMRHANAFRVINEMARLYPELLMKPAAQAFINETGIREIQALKVNVRQQHLDEVLPQESVDVATAKKPRM